MECKLIFIYPLPTIDEISSFYPDSYQCHSDVDKKEKRIIKEFIKKYLGFLFLDKTIEKKFKKIFKTFKKPLKDIKILEYGCGSCNMIVNLKKEFDLDKNQIVGVDFSNNAVETCKKNNIDAKQVYSINEINSKFDIIYSFQVLEHLSDPKEFINQCYLKLNNKGILYIQLPNNDGIGQRIFKRYWKGNDFPRRLFQFNKNNLSTLVGNKFEVLEFDTDRFYLSSIKLKKGLRLDESHWSDKTLWNIVFNLYLGRFLGFFGLGDNIHLILRKK